MKVVLVNPPQPELEQPSAYIPLGLAYIGAVLEQEDIRVEVLNMTSEASMSMLEKIPSADWYGITCTSATYPMVKRLVPTFMSMGKVAIGGPHPSVEPNRTIRDMKPDVVVVGEAEKLFPKIVRKKKYRNIYHTGIIRNLNNLHRNIYYAGIIENLNDLPFPARHLFANEDVVDVSGIHGQKKGVPATTIISSRGCPYRCSFCCKEHSMYYTYRYRAAGNVIEELKQIIKTYGIEHVRFVDDEFTLNFERVGKLCRKIRYEKLDLTWICITRADTVTSSLLREMKKAGCVEVHVGVESGSDRLLHDMGKQMTTKDLLAGIKRIKEAGIRVKTYLMWEYPGETEEDREATIRFMAEAKPDKYTISRFAPLPGSALASSNRSGWFYPDRWLKFKDKIDEVIRKD